MFLLVNLLFAICYLPIVPHQKLLPEIAQISQNFTNSDLILVDREATGDGWSMMAGPLYFLFGKQAIYFFNPEDLDKISVHNYSEIYFIIPDNQLGFYEKSGLLERLIAVKDYRIENNFLETNAVDKTIAYHSPITLPREQNAVVSGKLYLLKK